MRYLIAFLVMATTTAFAADWQKYSNDRFGVTIDVPPGFAQSGDAPANNDGLTFASADGKAILRVWGSNIIADNFKEELRNSFDSDQSDGWVVSYGASNKQKNMTWAVYSGTKKDMIMYEKSIASCKGTQSLHFRIEYPKAQKLSYDAVVLHLGKSMKIGPATDCNSP
jgi:hypothetical protein